MVGSFFNPVQFALPVRADGPPCHTSKEIDMNLPDSKLLIHQFLQTMRMRNCSEQTTSCWKYMLARFVGWCEERGLACMSEVTLDHLTAYRRNLFYYRSPRTGAPLKFDTQAHYLIPIRRWFAWMVDQRFLELDPALELELPKSESRLPTSVLTADEVETLLNLPDVKTPLGIRDRTIMETLYSTGIRRAELTGLDVYDIQVDREILTVRQGKGNKDRVVPIGQRALSWIEKWTHDIRPELVTESSAQSLFVSKNGRRLGTNYLSNLVKRYMVSIGITQRGSCHLLRHTAATLMMEEGADLRSLQQYLGHARLNTTQIYTPVSIKRLQEVHRKTHPAKPNEKPNHGSSGNDQDSSGDNQDSSGKDRSV
jgi:integrase/recombinase XerD